MIFSMARQLYNRLKVQQPRDALGVKGAHAAPDINLDVRGQYR